MRNQDSGRNDIVVHAVDNSANRNIRRRNLIFQVRRHTHFEDYSYGYNSDTGVLTGQGQLLRVNFEAKANRPVLAERVALEYLDPTTGQ